MLFIQDGWVDRFISHEIKWGMRGFLSKSNFHGVPVWIVYNYFVTREQDIIEGET